MAKRRKKKFLKKARASMKKRGTVGTFTAWCKRQGFSGVTSACIAKGKKSRSKVTQKRANFAKGMKTIARRRKRKKKR